MLGKHAARAGAIPLSSGMRVCLVTREFAPFRGWGAGTYASLCAQALAAAGHEVHVLTDDARCVREGPALRPGVRFHLVDLATFPMNLRAYASELQRYSLGVRHALEALHAQHAFDYIEFPDFLGEAYYTLRARRTMGALPGAVIGIRTHMTIRLIRAINRDDWIDAERATCEHMEAWSLAHADALIAPCEAIARKLREQLATQRYRCSQEALETPLRVVHLPIALDLQRAELRATARQEPQQPTIVFAGRFEWRKGPHVLLDAAQRLLRDGVDVRVRFIGEDTDTGPVRTSMLTWLRERVEPRFADRISFEPRAKREDLGAIFASATVVCVPSVWENFPFACTEAMACGACVVGSDAGGMAEIIEDGVSGLLFRGEDAGHLAQVLRRALDDTSLRAKLASNAAARIGAICEPGAIVRQVEQTVAQARETLQQRERRIAGDIATSIASDTSPAVSVIVPVYNTHEYLDETLASLRKQTFRNFETIIVDDGSTKPETIAHLAKLEREADNVSLRVVRASHGGLSHARNEGVRAAKARWIVPLDSDDMLHERGLEWLVAAKRRVPHAAFVTGALRSFDSDPAKPVAGWWPLGGDVDLLGVMNAASSCVALLERDTVLQAGGYDTTLPAYEDWDLYCTLMEREGVQQGEVVPEYLVLHRLRPSSMMHTLSRKRHHLLRARLLAKHPHLAQDAGRAMRLLLGDTIMLDPPSDAPVMDAAAITARAQELLRQNVRYRLADRVNAWLKQVGLQQVLKRMLAGR